MQSFLRDKLLIDTRRWPDYRGQYHATCPYCGKSPQAGQTHFSIFPNRRDGGYSFKCFVCGTGGHIDKLLRHIGVNAQFVSGMPEAKEWEPPYWTKQQDRLLTAYSARSDRFDLWQSHKPLKRASIQSWNLGVGYLPNQRTLRLIVPYFENGMLVALKGRSIDGAAPKWAYAKGSKTGLLFGIDRVEIGGKVVICENLVDSILITQDCPGITGVAIGGSGWSRSWTKQLMEKRPSAVVVWLDQDTSSAGQIRKHEVDIATQLADAGINVYLHRWPAGTPDKFDIGEALQKEERNGDTSSATASVSLR